MTLPYRPCVGAVILNNNGLIFSASRIDSTPDAWQMPQGGIDQDEDVKDAVLREIFEETSIKATSLKFIEEIPDWLYYDLPENIIPTIWNGKFRGQQQKWFLFKFLGDDSEIDITKEPREFSNWAWMSAEEIEEKIVPFKKSLYTSVFAYFSDHLELDIT